jgi:hypothetical protein
MSDVTADGAGRRDLLERRADVRISRLGRFIDAMHRRERVIKKEVVIDVELVVAGGAVAFVLLLGAFVAHRWTRPRGLRAWLSP